MVSGYVSPIVIHNYEYLFALIGVGGMWYCALVQIYYIMNSIAVIAIIAFKVPWILSLSPAETRVILGALENSYVAEGSN